MYNADSTYYYTNNNKRITESNLENYFNEEIELKYFYNDKLYTNDELFEFWIKNINNYEISDASGSNNYN